MRVDQNAGRRFGATWKSGIGKASWQKFVAPKMSEGTQGN